MQGDNSEELRKEAHELIDLIEDAITDLSYFSARNEDIFNGEIDRMEQEVRNCRKQLL